MPPISFEPLEATFGARVHGLDIDRLDGDELAVTLAAELERQGVLVVGGIDLSPDDLIRIGGLFGSVAAADDVSLPGQHEIGVVTNVGADDQIAVDAAQMVENLTPRWHAPGSFRAAPPRCSISYAVEVPRRGGQTQFADMRKALRLLPPDDRHEIAQLRLVHGRDGSTEATVEHPWIRSNSDGTRSLYMGVHALHIAGREADQSRQWFAEIEAQLLVHDVVYEHQWRAHDLVVCDNRTVMHRTLGYDITNERRVIHTVHVAGDWLDWPPTSQ